MKDWSNIFGSKLNTALLLVLIVLMSFTLKVMLKDKETFFSYLSEDEMKKIDEEQRKLVTDTARSKIQGNKDDLVAFSILPDSKVHGVVSFRGVVQGGYFFEGNILINVLDLSKKRILESNAMAKGEWMTAGPVEFEGNLDFGALPKGPAYLEIHNDNASGLPENDKFILIPIVVE